MKIIFVEGSGGNDVVASLPEVIANKIIHLAQK